jgi:hypothetical protein
VLTLLIDVDRAVAGWEPDAKGTVERLHQLVARGWRPCDTTAMGGYASRIEQWVIAAAELLDRRPVLHLDVPCPSCAARWTYHRNAGEQVRVRALRVSEDGASCGACHAFWPPAEFHWLARLLGSASLPAG